MVLYLEATTTGIPQRSVLGPVLFNTFINDLEGAMECILIQSADHTSWGTQSIYLRAGLLSRGTLDSLERYIDRNHMKFQWHVPKSCTWAGRTPASTITREKDPGGGGEQQAGHEAIACPSSKGDQMHPGWHEQKQLTNWGKWLSPSALATS